MGCKSQNLVLSVEQFHEQIPDLKEAASDDSGQFISSTLDAANEKEFGLLDPSGSSFHSRQEISHLLKNFISFCNFNFQGNEHQYSVTSLLALMESSKTLHLLSSVVRNQLLPTPGAFSDEKIKDDGAGTKKSKGKGNNKKSEKDSDEVNLK
ncbi:EF-hand calcium-binding domain-containing protein 1 [Striga asiatica]|uniref:EF-hand calcium-binding domain-containing protein 1 n=1 Tax=Striga asiatica TaxID=4170 RepID=A0A5A7RIP6_STRAF|nr:EF-hand calcium-binding domain-containing protein 1 [Striga asiatica]